jgi:ATP-binding cassette, subfamily F, member 3
MLNVKDVTYRLGERLILDQASFFAPEGSRIGLAGRNGAGKTTLFKIIQGELSTESGSIHMPRQARIGAVAQEVPSGPESLIDVVLAADTERTSLLKEAETADGLRRADIEMRLNDIDAHAAPARAGAILHGLGFDKEAQERPCSSFSGGWRMRVALAAALFAAPDVLLLDEPTNYLDLEGTLWLYDYLGRYPHSLIIISHDRELLDTCVDHILHLDRGKLNLYRGGYTAFEKLRAEQQALQGKLRVKQEAERKHLQAFVDRFKAKASKARQAQSRVKRLEKLQPISALVEDATLNFHLPSPERPFAPPLIALEGAAAGYGDKIVLNHLNLTILPDDRIALLGSNGNGKSTFAKLLSGRLEPLKGAVKRPAKLDIAFFAQHQLDELRPDENAIQHIAEKMIGQPESRIRARAAQLGFPGVKGETPIAKLSGGEKARLLMGLAAFRGPHLLVLDEPTNHLDIDSRAALMEAINDYEGAVLLISHDRFLIEACADRLWLVGDGTVKSFDGDMEDYRRLVLSGNSAPKKPKEEAPRLAEKSPQPAKANPVMFTPQAARKRIAALDERMDKIRLIIAKIDKALGEGKAFQTDPVNARDLARMRAEAELSLSKAEEEWLELSAQMS